MVPFYKYSVWAAWCHVTCRRSSMHQPWGGGGWVCAHLHLPGPWLPQVCYPLCRIPSPWFCLKSCHFYRRDVYWKGPHCTRSAAWASDATWAQVTGVRPQPAPSTQYLGICAASGSPLPVFRLLFCCDTQSPLPLGRLSCCGRFPAWVLSCRTGVLLIPAPQTWGHSRSDQHRTWSPVSDWHAAHRTWRPSAHLAKKCFRRRHSIPEILQFKF